MESERWSVVIAARRSAERLHCCRVRWSSATSNAGSSTQPLRVGCCCEAMPGPQRGPWPDTRGLEPAAPLGSFVGGGAELDKIAALLIDIGTSRSLVPGALARRRRRCELQPPSATRQGVPSVSSALRRSATLRWLRRPSRRHLACKRFRTIRSQDAGRIPEK